MVQPAENSFFSPSFAKAMCHLMEDCTTRLENTRAYHCFQDEDTIGQWKKLCNGMTSILSSHSCKTFLCCCRLGSWVSEVSFKSTSVQGAGMEYRLLSRYLLRLGASSKH